MVPFVVWKTRRVPNGAIVMDLEGVDDVFEMRDGASFKAIFPSTARFKFNPDYKRNVQPVDFFVNVDDMMLCSQRAMEFVRSHNPPAVEYLPVGVLDHKGKALASAYFIVHPIDPPDCIDFAKSVVTRSAIDPSSIQEADHLVIDAARVPSGRLLFRPKAYPDVLLLRREFAQAIEQQGFSGARCVEIE